MGSRWSGGHSTISHLIPLTSDAYPPHVLPVCDFLQQAVKSSECTHGVTCTMVVSRLPHCWLRTRPCGGRAAYCQDFYHYAEVHVLVNRTGRVKRYRIPICVYKVLLQETAATDSRNAISKSLVASKATSVLRKALSIFMIA